jgi:hypothetical protein
MRVTAPLTLTCEPIRTVFREGFMKTICTAALLIGTLATAQAHDWITGLRNRDGYLFCGSKDCTPIDPATVTPNSGGYYLQSFKETVPYSEVLPSQEHFYWRCSTWDYEAADVVRQCFFAPPVSW